MRNDNVYGYQQMNNYNYGGNSNYAPVQVVGGENDPARTAIYE